MFHTKFLGEMDGRISLQGPLAVLVKFQHPVIPLTVRVTKKKPFFLRYYLMVMKTLACLEKRLKPHDYFKRESKK